MGPFTLDELNQAIDTLKPNKAGGPDELIIKLFKDLDEENRHRVVGLHNDIYEKKSFNPLPILYIIAISCLMMDMLRWETDHLLPLGAHHQALLFVVDTLLLSNNAAKMTRLLHLVIEHSKEHNLNLDRDKCNLLVT